MWSSVAIILAVTAASPRTGVPIQEPGYAYWYEWRASRTEPRIRLPFLVKYPKPQIQAAVNAEIQKKLDGMGCGRAPAGEHWLWETTARVTYADREIFSVDIVTERDCGGPYPTNAAPGPITFDLRTGKRVGFADLFESYKQNKPAIIRAVFGKHIGKSIESDGCPSLWSLEDMMQYAGPYYVVPGGIVVTPEFPHVMEACAFQETVSASALRPLAAPDAVLMRLQP
jgi:hypothetical protein